MLYLKLDGLQTREAGPGQPSYVVKDDDRQSRLARPAATLAAVLLLVASGALAYLSPLGHTPTFYETAVAEIQRAQLPDGSSVTLGPRSRFEFDFSGPVRRVVLVNGEAFFRVAHDGDHPFLVVAGGTQIRAVGTAFNVHRGPIGVTVSVAEGAVEIAKPRVVRSSTQLGAREGSRRLEAGQKSVVAKSGEFGAVKRISPDRPGAWIKAGFTTKTTRRAR